MLTATGSRSDRGEGGDDGWITEPGEAALDEPAAESGDEVAEDEFERVGHRSHPSMKSRLQNRTRNTLPQFFTHGLKPLFEAVHHEAFPNSPAHHWLQDCFGAAAVPRCGP